MSGFTAIVIGLTSKAAECQWRLLKGNAQSKEATPLALSEWQLTEFTKARSRYKTVRKLWGPMRFHKYLVGSEPELGMHAKASIKSDLSSAESHSDAGALPAPSCVYPLPNSTGTMHISDRDTWVTSLTDRPTGQ